MNKQPDLSLYLHIPFCHHRCAYCDFNTYSSLSGLKEAYAAAIVQEIAQVSADARRRVSTVYFGGGTPSLMAPYAMERIMAAVRHGFRLNEDAEITLEANPDTVDEPYLGALQRLGFNRLSLGMQSAVPAELALLERQHGLDAVVRAMRAARAAGFDNVSLDLIYGLPGQSLRSWQASLEAALQLAPQHLSLYCLTIEPGTPMGRWLLDGRLQAPDPDLAADQYQFACDRLGELGWTHYELSNWTKPGRACRHNLAYWRNQAYLGLGAGAHGHAAGFRYQVVKRPRVYLRRIHEARKARYPWSSAVSEYHRLSQTEQMSDTVITQLRLLEEGLDLEAFAAQFGQQLSEAFPGVVEQLDSWGLLEEQGQRLRLTERGQFLSNQVFYRFL